MFWLTRQSREHISTIAFLKLKTCITWTAAEFWAFVIVNPFFWLFDSVALYKPWLARNHKALSLADHDYKFLQALLSHSVLKSMVQFGKPKK